MILANRLAGSGSVAKTYVDDVFATNLYTGPSTWGSTNIINGINLLGKGGMVWVKSRGIRDHCILNSTFNGLATNKTDAQSASYNTGSSFNSNGFSLGAYSQFNNLSESYVAYTFRKAPKFFDVVTYTGNGDYSSGGLTVPHSLGQRPGMVFYKKTSATSNWAVGHKGDGVSAFFRNGVLNSTAVLESVGGDYLAVGTSTILYAWSQTGMNDSGSTYVAYIFGDDSSPDGLVRCGSYIGNGSATGPVVDLGWEPQWLMVKNASGAGSWHMIDNQRGFTFDGLDQTTQANSSAVEAAQTYIGIRSNGFQVVSTSSEVNTSGATYIYMAIRRSNKPPTSGEQVFDLAVINSGVGGAIVGLTTQSTKGSYLKNCDMAWIGFRDGHADNFAIADKVRGWSKYPTYTTSQLTTSSTAAENITTPHFATVGLAGYEDYLGVDGVGGNRVTYTFKRAAGFFDVVAFKSAGAGTVVKHGLGVIPQLVIIKSTKAGGDWTVGHNIDGLVSWSGSRRGSLNSSGTFSANTGTFNPATATEVIPSQGSECIVDRNYIMYLFATLPGISKVGIYTGNATARTIPCGFVGGARFVLIKRTDAVGDWYVYDTARGITATEGSNPFILLNSAAAQSYGVGITAAADGFALSNTTPLNTSGGTYIFLAIA